MQPNMSGYISKDWRKDKRPLKEYTGYIIAGSIITRAICLPDQQTCQHTYINVKSSGFQLQ